jgi:hypothetical protein
MTIFRHNQNKLLYTIAWCTPRRYTGGRYEAIPYKHDTWLTREGRNRRKGEFTAKMNLSDFTAVSEA